ncbi:MAG: TonB family protein [Terriglobales bacterium]
MATPAASPEPLVRSDERFGPRKAVVDAGLVTVEMCPAGFALMLNVSNNGIGVYTLKRLKEGQDLQISFLLPGSVQRIDCTGQVRWAMGDHAGLQLRNIDQRCFSKLQTWIASLPAVAAAPNPVSLRREFPVLDEQVRAMEKHITEDNLPRDQALQFLVLRMIDVTKASGAAIAVREAGEMVCRASAGLAPEVGVRIASTSGVTGECIRSGKLIYCEDTEHDPRVDREACRELNLRSSLIVPVMHEQKVSGVLELFSPSPAAFSANHRWLAQRLAEVTAQVAHGVAKKPAPAAPSQIAAPTPQVAPTIPPKPTAPANTKRVAQGRKMVEAVQPAPQPVAPAPVVKPELALAEPAAKRYIRVLLFVAALVAVSVAVLLMVRSRAKTPAPTRSAAPLQPITSPSAATAPVATAPSLKEQVHASREAQREKRAVAETPSAPKPMMLARSEGGVKASAPVQAPVEAPMVHLGPTADLKDVPVPVAVPILTETPQLKRAAAITGGVLIHRVDPTYPRLALQKRIEGDVVLQAHIAKDGTIARVRQIKGSPVLGGPAIAAVKQWRYEPFKRDNIPLEMDSTITIQFHIPQSAWTR